MLNIRAYLFISLLLLSNCAFALTDSFKCEEPTIPKEYSNMIAELNLTSDISTPALVSYVFKSIPSQHTKAFYIKLSSKNKSKLWKVKLKNKLNDADLNSQQEEFIVHLIDEMNTIQSLDNTILKNIDYINSLETQATQFFTDPEIKEYFYNISIVKKNDIPKQNSNIIQLDFETKPTCDCATSSSFKCSGCAFGPSRCRWVNRGCGFLSMGACNGKCPGF